MKEVIETLFDGVWKLYSSFDTPGFGVSLAKVAVGFFVVRFSLNLISLVTGLHSDAGYAAENYFRSSERYNHYRDKKRSSSDP